MNDIKTLTPGSGSYPGKLLDLQEPPEMIRCIGNIPATSPSLAIVGSRNCTEYGRRMAREFGSALAQRGVTIISGMARGIDSAAQESALEAGGKSIAVLGCGVDICYPSSNRKLYSALCESGAVISELPDGSPPMAHNFPRRNRIISALADIVLVVEAAWKSGSLITAQLALELGRTVYAVPGRVGDLTSDGCNELLYQGAGVAYSPEALLLELKMTPQKGETFAAKQKKKQASLALLLDNVHNDPYLSDTAKEVFSRLTFTDPANAEELASKMKTPAPELSFALTQLVASGYVEEVCRGFFRRRMSPSSTSRVLRRR